MIEIRISAESPEELLSKLRALATQPVPTKPAASQKPTANTKPAAPAKAETAKPAPADKPVPADKPAAPAEPAADVATVNQVVELVNKLLEVAGQDTARETIGRLLNGYGVAKIGELDDKSRTEMAATLRSEIAAHDEIPF